MSRPELDLVDDVYIGRYESSYNFVPWMTESGETVMIDRRRLSRHYSGGKNEFDAYFSSGLYEILDRCEELAREAIAARAAAIRLANGYFADLGARVLRDRQAPYASQCPCLVVALGERTAAETGYRVALCELTVEVIGYRTLDSGDAESIGVEILADIQRAVELDDAHLGGLLGGSEKGLAFQSEQVFLPDAGEGVVAGQVVYSAPHIRRAGEPDIE